MIPTLTRSALPTLPPRGGGCASCVVADEIGESPMLSRLSTGLAPHDSSTATLCHLHSRSRVGKVSTTLAGRGLRRNFSFTDSATAEVDRCRRHALAQRTSHPKSAPGAVRTARLCNQLVIVDQAVRARRRASSRLLVGSSSALHPRDCPRMDTVSAAARKPAAEAETRRVIRGDRRDRRLSHRG